jgi:hypothetical protein
VGAGRAIGADDAGLGAAGAAGLAGAGAAGFAAALGAAAAARGFLVARLGAARLALRAVVPAFLAALRAVAVLPRVVVVFRRAADFAALRVAVARLAVFFVVFFFAFFALRAIAITSSWLSLTRCYFGGADPQVDVAPPSTLVFTSPVRANRSAP